MMDIEDLLIPVDVLTGTSREAVLLYAMLRLHADENGNCRQARWLGALAGLRQEMYQAAAVELESIGAVQRFKYADDYGHSTGFRLLDWLCPTRQERLTGKAWAEIRQAVFERDRNTCAYCQVRFLSVDSLECDHIEPISIGGTNEMGNLVTACGACNRSKHAKLIDAWKGRVA